jgi:hypothetical protein
MVFAYNVMLSINKTASTYISMEQLKNYEKQIANFVQNHIIYLPPI